MGYLLLAILSSVGVAHLFKYAERDGLPVYPLFAANYLVAAVTAFAGSGGSIGAMLQPAAAGVAVFLGVLFIWCFVLLMKSVEKLGMVLPVSLMRLAAVLPTMGSILLFAEIPNTYQLAGILIAFGALPLASARRITRSDFRRLLGEGLGWGLLLFASFGLTEFLLKVHIEYFRGIPTWQLMTVIFSTALVTALIMMRTKRQRLTWRVFRVGILLGGLNMLSTLFFLEALRVLPGIVIYPTNGISVIVLSALLGVLFWKEKLSRRNQAFIALAIVAIFLISR